MPWHRQRRRPLCIGSSVRHFNVTAGTLGAFLRPRGGGPLAMLSNNHVLANENRGKKGDAILQPGAIDDGQNPADGVATLADFVRFKRLGANLVDAATAAVNEGIEADLTRLKGMGKLKGMGDVFVDEGTGVVKIGRPTGRTVGRVTVGITRIEDGYGLKVNLERPPESPLPTEVDGIPLRVEIVGSIRKREVTEGQ